MGTSICKICPRNDPRSLSYEMSEEVHSELQISLQEIDKISEFVSPNNQKAPNSYLESIYIFIDCIRYRLSTKVLAQLIPMRHLRLAIQRFREALHEIRPQDSIDIMPEAKERSLHLITQLELDVKTNFGGPLTMGFYDSDVTVQGFDQIFEKMGKMHKDLRGKEEKISQEIISKLTSNISANFWINSSFQGSTAKWKEFSEAFKKFNMKCLNLNLEPHDLIMIQGEIDLNNDLLIDIECWDLFYAEIWSNSIKRGNLLSKSLEMKEFLLSPSKTSMELRYFRNNPSPSEGKEVFFPNNSLFYIQEDKIKYSPNLNLQPKEKDLYNGILLAGKHPKAEISFDKSIKEVPTRQFQMHMKKIVFQKTQQNQNEYGVTDSQALGYKPRVETWFYINNMAKKNLLNFLVDEKGFALTKGMIVNVNGNSFKINEINPSPVLYADDDLYYVDSRPKGPNKPTYKNQLDFSIDLEFFKNGPKEIKQFQFTVPKKDDFFQITIGSLNRRSKKSNIYIEDEHENFVSREHCVIVYNPKKSCWIIKDETYNKSLLPFYKTFVFACGYEEYEIIHKLDKDTDYVARGQRLSDGMKFTFVNNIFEAKLIN